MNPLFWNINNNNKAPRNDGKGKSLASGPNLDPTGHRIRSLRTGLISTFNSPRRMTNISPFPDLNRMPPDSLPGTSSSSAAGKPILPVKPEPIDDSDLLAQYTLLHEYFTKNFDELANSQAIVPVPEPESQVLEPPPGFENRRVSSTAVSQRRLPQFQRPTELARVTDVGPEQEKLLRDIYKKTRMVYDSLRMHLAKEEMRGPARRKPRSDTKAASLMRERGLWINNEKHLVGHIPGAKIGDVFFYREELRVVGLHGQPQGGIDTLTAHRSANGEPIATSIIVSGGYEDDQDLGDVLVYSGQGGQDKKLHRQCQHQKLVGGNLGMERSMHYDIEVRVIRGIKYDNSVSHKVYVYDGVYKIVNSWLAQGRSNFGVYKFHLVRLPGQPEMGSVTMRLAKALKKEPLTVRPAGYVSFDISRKSENVPVYLFNDIDSDWEPLNYDYIVRSVIPHEIAAQAEINKTGCDCSFSCGDDCLCTRKNGGELAYDDNGTLLRGKPVVFECGKFCKCGPSCKNRVTQKGLKTRLEVFRSRETGWGVRTLDIIHAGAFICEFAGVMLTRYQAGILSMNGDNMVYPGQFTEKWRNWGDLSQMYPDDVRPADPSLPPLDFAMDVSRMRNVACYISHSTDPNVMVQFVLYDHNNLVFPRVMLFALENIPPLAELSLDYGLADEVDAKLAICN